MLAIISISALILLISVVIAEISNSDKTIKKDIMSKIFTRYSPNDGSVSSALKSVGKIGEELPLNLINDELLFKICLISDIHEDDANLKKAFEKILQSGCDKIFVIGDVTNYGDVESLKKVRSILDSYGVEYYAIPGDHDIAESLDALNFNNVFGINYHIVEYRGVWFMLFDNSANFTEIGATQMSWINRNIDRVDFVVMSQPLYTEGLNPPFSITYMGSLPATPEGDDMKEKQAKVKVQRDLLLDMIRKNANIKAVFSGEHHRSSKIQDSVRSGLEYYVVGAVTSTVNDFPQTAIQTSRFSVLSVYKNNKYAVDEVLID